MMTVLLFVIRHQKSPYYFIQSPKFDTILAAYGKKCNNFKKLSPLIFHTLALHSQYSYKF